MNIIYFIFSDFWHWFGAFLLLWIPFDGIAKIIRAIKGTDTKENADE